MVEVQCNLGIQSVASTMDQSLLDLPDDVLLAVLAYLSPVELLACRVLCRRLRDLCLHRELWKTAHVRSVVGDRGVARAALRLAPCLRRVFFGDLGPISSLVASTECAVTELSVLVRLDTEVAPATAIVQKFATLGGLKSLDLLLGMSLEIDTAYDLLEAVYRLTCLRELKISVCQNSELGDPRRDGARVRSSLVKLSYSRFQDPFLELLLTTHGATLEEVALLTGDSLPVNLLAAMPRLRSLTCHMSNELVYSHGLSRLETLHLNASDRFFTPNALEFFRRAPNLRTVSFSVPRQDPASPLQALAASPSARVLEVLNLRWGAPHLMDLTWLAGFIPRFPSLRSLSLDTSLLRVDLDGLLQSVTPTSAPSLTALRMTSSGCPHAWLHRSAVQELLTRNARLHLHVGGDIPRQCSCEWCSRGCHAGLRGTLSRRAMASHRRTAGCPSGCCMWP
ncbi:uncharacterized protein LOC117648502 [Thrips palmi]|uniref:Uncharacterized protein LOC117648502 n=1 Tax=Thrips palmi TaxID=161013 RepID=A0A6P8Z339_THRPL|nr:uncharacterized protein LOC117648502 [Thrips palmi]